MFINLIFTDSIKRLLQELRSIDVDFLDGVEIETVEVSTIVVPENVTRTRKNLNPAQIVEPQDPMIQLQDAGQQITDQPIVEQQNTEQQDAAPQNIELQNAQETPNLVQQMSFTNSTSNIRLSIQRDLQPIPRIFNISALQDTPERFQAKASSLIINNTGQVIDTSFIAPVYGSNIQINEISAIDDNSMIPMRYIDNIPVDSETSSRLLAPAQSNMEAFNHEEPQEIVSAIKALEGGLHNYSNKHI